MKRMHLSEPGRIAVRLTTSVLVLAVLLMVSSLAMRLVTAPEFERRDYWEAVLAVGSRPIVAYWSAALIFGILISLFTGNNRVSMHSFYRNRLISCYLGAGAPAEASSCFATSRNGAAFDLALDKLADASRYRGPYPIFNASLNVVNGGELAWQERKACSFLLSPKYSGFDSAGEIRTEAYRSSAQYGYDGRDMTLGQAMAISGAALGPYMGMYSFRLLAFLFSTLNVRLGWWLPNPNLPMADRVSACNRLLMSVRELFGSITHTSRHIYLSDGGHFDNMGIYQLVKRGCRLIICVDATSDRELTCDDLANSIERCRVDLGVDIECDPAVLLNRKDRGWMAGTICYQRAGMGAAGLLLSIKATVTGKEPFDVIAYARRHSRFPHDSSINQWFKERQFESYRKLGELLTLTAFQEWPGELVLEAVTGKVRHSRDEDAFTAKV